MKILPALLAVAQVPALTSCLQLPPIGTTGCHHAECAERQREASRTEPDPWIRSAEEPTVLYARDGTPVAGEDDQLASAPVGPGAAGESGPPVPSGSTMAPNARDVEREDGRLYLLELYQNAVDERDELLAETGRQEAIILDLQSMQETLDQQFAEMQTRLFALEQEKLVAEEQSFELASRLTTAQIGRLQAELRELRGRALGGAVEYPLREDGASAPAGADTRRLDPSQVTPGRSTAGRPGPGQSGREGSAD